MLDTIEKELAANSQAAGSGSSTWSDYKPHLERKLFFPKKDSQ